MRVCFALFVALDRNLVTIATSYYMFPTIIKSVILFRLRKFRLALASIPYGMR